MEESKYKKLRKINSKTHKKNLDHMNLLVSDKEFQEDISELRDSLNIDSEIFEDDNLFKEWWDELIRKTDEVDGSKEYNKKRNKLIRKRDSGEINLKEFKKKFLKLRDGVPLYFLWNRINFIIDKFNIPLHFKNNIMTYVTRNKITAPSQNFKSGPYKHGKTPWTARYAPIKIYSKLTNEELKALKLNIEAFNKKLPEYQPLKDIDRDLSIEEWHENKARFDYVENEEYEITNKEIAEEFLGSPDKAKQIPDIVNKLKKKREKRFHKDKNSENI